MHKVTVQPSGQSFEAQAGESVLAAALRQGVMLPYGCKNGACGSCKGKILAGAVDYGHYHARVLTEAERSHGKALFCQAKPLGELVIESRTIGAAKDIAVRLLPCRVQQLEKVADDVMIVRLKLPANERLQFLAGQYIDFLLKGGERRSFSMANAPHADELLELHIRQVAGGSFTEHVTSCVWKGRSAASSCARTAPSRSCWWRAAPALRRSSRSSRARCIARSRARWCSIGALAGRKTCT
jgi:CDP-4-dehydro-6-deoxyglucose reductase